MFVAVLAWTYYSLGTYLALTQAINPMLEHLERLANQANATDPAPRAPTDLDFPARAQETREDYWTNDIIFRNTSLETDDTYRNYTLAIDRPLHDYL